MSKKETKVDAQIFKK